MKFNWKLFAAVSTLTGAIVGAGFLGIPFVVAKSGFIIGAIEIIILGLILLTAKLYLGEILLRTKKTHQLPGLAKLYLGKWGGRIMLFSLLFGIYSALIAYLIGEGQSFSFLFFGNIDYTIYFALGFWLILTVLVSKGIKSLKKGESFGMIAVIAILFFILLYFAKDISLSNLSAFDFNYAFIPVGVIIFALMGFSAIPEVVRELKGNEKLLKKSIIIGAIVPIFIYLLFTVVVIGFSGTATPEIATFALGKIFVFLGIFTMFTSFFVLSVSLMDVYRFDLNYGKKKSWLLACLSPLILFLIVYFFDLLSFTQILGIGGTITGGFSAVLVLLMVRNARKIGKRKPEYKVKLPTGIIWFLIIFLILGLLLELLF